MPRIVSSAEKTRAIALMTETDEDGNFKYGQREIERETDLSRPYIRKLAQMIGHQFPRNGIEVKGRPCMCANCGIIFRKSPSKVERAKNQFCDELCKQAFMKGPNHPNWRTGVTMASFSTWVKNQSGYQKWCDAVLEKCDHKCTVSGRTDDLECHHIFMKAEGCNPEKAFDVDNGTVLNKEVHNRVHALIREGLGYEEALVRVKDEYEHVESK